MAEAAVVKRLYIGGFAQPVTADEMSGRFKPFGQVQDVDIPTTPTGCGTRGFGYVSLSITPAQLQRCIKVYTGARWKGGELRIEEAKEDYMTRLRRELAEAKEEPAEVNVCRQQHQETASITGVHAADMAPVTPKTLDQYEGWTRNKYGRPVLKHTLVKPNGKSLTYDPAKHKHSIERVFASADPKKPSDLLWEYNPDDVLSEFKKARKLSPETLAECEKIEKRLARKRQIEGDAQRAHKRMLLQNQTVVAGAQTEYGKEDNNDDGGFESDSGSEILDVDTAEILARQNINDGAAAFENADEIAMLVASATAKLNPELQAKLESGVFDSSSEDEDDEQAP
ncbi:hypothetical protein IWW50_004977, partial [Coemansia erecta]